MQKGYRGVEKLTNDEENQQKHEVLDLRTVLLQSVAVK